MSFTAAAPLRGYAQPARLQRVANSALSHGHSGVLGSTDLFLRALGATGVSADPGGAIMANRFPTASGREAYVVSNDSASGDAILGPPPADPAAEKVDFCIYRVYDPEYAGVSDPTAGKGGRLEWVPSVDGLAYPHVVLGKLTQPPGNTAGVQQPMLDDTPRKVAPGPGELVQYDQPSYAGESGQVLTSHDAGGEYWPNNGSADMVIPDWATHVQIRGEWLSVAVAPNVNPYGQQWIEFGPVVGTTNNRQVATQKYQFNLLTAAEAQRVNLVCRDTVRIPPELRGTTTRIGFHARYGGADEGLSLDEWSGTGLDLKFIELAESPLA